MTSSYAFSLDSLARTHVDQLRVSVAPNSYPDDLQLFPMFNCRCSLAMWYTYVFLVEAFLRPESRLIFEPSTVDLAQATFEDTVGPLSWLLLKVVTFAAALHGYSAVELDAVRLRSISADFTGTASYQVVLNVRSAIAAELIGVANYSIKRLAIYREGRPALRVEALQVYRRNRRGGQIVILEDPTI